jgi:trehalose synthase
MRVMYGPCAVQHAVGVAPNHWKRRKSVSLAESVTVVRRPIAQLEPVIGRERHELLVGTAERFRQRLAGRAVWNISSTAVGGGVAEMLQVLLGYAEDFDIRSRWMVITGDAEFFVLTKRIHNQIHGETAGGPLTKADGAHYERMLAANAAELVEQIRPGDLVLLHDPQTAGLAAPLTEAGAVVAWRCHIGVDWENDATEAAWSFLRPHLAAVRGFVFSRAEYVPSWIPPEQVAIIPPSIDPFSPKNQHLDDDTVLGIMARIGVLDGAVDGKRTSFVRRSGGPGAVSRTAEITGDARPDPGDPLVVQVSRWDKLKDMPGVMRGFADYIAPAGDGYLLLVGPAVAGVTDDPEGAAVFGECLLQWRDLPKAVRSRVLLITLPLDDADENAAMVNALQRHATVIVQKSLAEGFGLTVAEGMWKGRPVVGSAVGGIIDQIAEGTGILLPDPRNLEAFGAAVRQLLDDQGEASQMGRAARAYIGEHYVGDLHLLRYASLFDALLSGSNVKTGNGARVPM